MSTPHAPGPPRGELVELVPVERLHTRLAGLRSAIPRPGREGLAELPLRAVPVGDALEVVDGFKRLERWRAEGRRVVPVVVERERSLEEAYALLLRANAPRRTTTAMDEARVVVALLQRKGVGEATVARLLERRVGWVRRRRDLATRLVAPVQRRVDAGAIRPTVAEALTRVPGRDQERVVRAIEVNALNAREARLLVEAFGSLEEDEERAALLQDPLDWVRRPPRASSLGPLAEVLAGELQRFRGALRDLAAFELPAQGLSDPERRRLEAERRGVIHQLREALEALASDREEEPRAGGAEGEPPTAGRLVATAAQRPGELPDRHAAQHAAGTSVERRATTPATQCATPAEASAPPPEPRRAGGDPAPGGGGPRDPGDRPSPRPRPQAGPLGRGGEAAGRITHPGNASPGLAPGPLPGPDRREGRGGPDGHPDPARDRG